MKGWGAVVNKDQRLSVVGLDSVDLVAVLAEVLDWSATCAKVVLLVDTRGWQYCCFKLLMAS